MDLQARLHSQFTGEVNLLRELCGKVLRSIKCYAKPNNRLRYLRWAKTPKNYGETNQKASSLGTHRVRSSVAAGSRFGDHLRRSRKDTCVAAWIAKHDAMY